MKQIYQTIYYALLLTLVRVSILHPMGLNLPIDPRFNTMLENLLAIPTFSEWQEKIEQLPTFKEHVQVFGRLAFEPIYNNNNIVFQDPQSYKKYKAVSLKEFQDVAHKLHLATLQIFQAELDKALPQDNYDQANPRESFTPYAQKLEVSPGTVIAFHGDIHGDVHSLTNYIGRLQQMGYMDEHNAFKIKEDQDFYLIFLGDYVDRGVYGVEVLYMLMILKLTNPERVILVRGNHEDPTLTEQYGFDREYFCKFDLEQETPQTDIDLHSVFGSLNEFYTALPVVLYVGCNNNFVQCCHGGLEIGYDPIKFLATPGVKYQLLGNLLEYTNYQNCIYPEILHQESFEQEQLSKFAYLYINYIPAGPATIIAESSDRRSNGFMWGDFEADSCASSAFCTRRGSFRYGKCFTHAALQAFGLKGVIRAHQHAALDTDLLMQTMLNSHGVARLWVDNISQKFNFYDKIVITLLVSPETSIGTRTEAFQGFDFDTSLILTVAEQFNDWQGIALNNKLHRERSGYSSSSSSSSATSEQFPPG